MGLTLKEKLQVIGILCASAYLILFTRDEIDTFGWIVFIVIISVWSGYLYYKHQTNKDNQNEPLRKQVFEFDRDDPIYQKIIEKTSERLPKFLKHCENRHEDEGLIDMVSVPLSVFLSNTVDIDTQKTYIWCSFRANQEGNTYSYLAFPLAEDLEYYGISDNDPVAIDPSVIVNWATLDLDTEHVIAGDYLSQYRSAIIHLKNESNKSIDYNNDINRYEEKLDTILTQKELTSIPEMVQRYYLE